MRKLSETEMENTKGGCGDIAAIGAVSFSGLGLIALAAGPVGWGAALIWGGAGMAVALICSE